MQKEQRILVTGMTAQHYSSTVASRSLSFAGIVSDSLRESGCIVDLTEPMLAWDSDFLSQYDRVLVGVAPPLSVAANGTYAALTTISKMKDDDRLMLFVDAPEPWQIFANLRAISKNSDTLFRQFYSRRKGYQDVTGKKATRKAVLNATTHLEASQWPKTLFPALPWNADPSKFPGVPQTAYESMIPIFVDSLIISKEMNFNSSRMRRWIVENDSSWTRKTISTLATPSVSIKEQKIRTSADLYSAMNSSIGAIVGQHGDKMTWWSTAYSHAINACTPIATDWRVSGSIGNAWNHLASGIEEMSQIDQYELAVSQKIQYLESIPTKDETTSNIRQLVKV